MACSTSGLETGGSAKTLQVASRVTTAGRFHDEPATAMRWPSSPAMSAGSFTVAAIRNRHRLHCEYRGRNEEHRKTNRCSGTEFAKALAP